ncbi:Hypothetical protein FKW44_008503, partial [Caligus rogercresseyi]
MKKQGKFRCHRVRFNEDTILTCCGRPNEGSPMETFFQNDFEGLPNIDYTRSMALTFPM